MFFFLGHVLIIDWLIVQLFLFFFVIHVVMLILVLIFLSVVSVALVKLVTKAKLSKVFNVPGGGALGHPVVYFNLDSGKPVSCNYCGVRYVMKDTHHH